MASRAQPVLWRETVKAGAVRSGALVAALILFAVTLMLVLALASYRASDPALNTASGAAPANWMGHPGAWIADIALTPFGPAVALILPVGPIIATRLWRDRPAGRWVKMLRQAVLGVALMACALSFVSDSAVLALPAGWGGVIGLSVVNLVRWVLGFTGQAAVVTWGSAAIGLALGIGGALIWGRSLELDIAERGLARLRRRRAANEDGESVPWDDEDEALYDEDEDEEPLTLARKAVPVREDRPAPVIADRQVAPAPAKPKTAADRDAPYQLPGPVVTMYELEPAPGIKANRVIALADDIARNMSAISARVAVIPGRNVIGIELPNAKREMVSLHELVASQSFADQAAQLPIILGKNIAGDSVVADLAPMPHLLVAGTTGSGKSVGLNGMILSLLYRLTPEQCRMIMIDPKMLELSMYDDIPHLLSPVVTDPAKAVRALKWAVETMEDRYRQMSSVGVRSLASFNDKVRAAKAKGQPLGRKVQTGYHPETGQPVYEEEKLEYEPLPQIVVIVDELADLMMTAGKEVEFLIQRLAQKARAAGIHLIMATQRPSVDVITGVIKANLPTRISFHVTSKIDSRTILGEQGAEQLLGRGDMLYMPGGKGIVRVHGPFVSDDEVHRVADHWRAQGQPDYISSVTEEPAESFALDGAPTGEDSAEDQQYRAAIQLVCESQKASTSWLQRQLRIGYNSAARLIERMETDGIVSRPDHVGRREVLRDTEGHPV